MGQEGDEQREDGQAALEARVSRLEQELAELRQLLGSTPQPGVAAPISTPPETAQTVLDAARTAPPPPVPPLFARELPPKPFPVKPAAKQESLENRLGSQVFNRLGILVVLIGTALFLKLAIDRRWVGATGRIAIGLIAGAALVLWSERFRRKGFAAFSYSLKALGSGVLYLALWAGFQLYHLFPAPVALALMLGVTAWNAYMAWAQSSELLAAYALAGAFLTPILLSTGGDHEAFLFTYLLAIDIATVVLVKLKRWPRLLLGAFPATVAFFFAWFFQDFHTAALSLTSAFLILFHGTFSSVPIHHGEAEVGARGKRSTLIEDILLPLANAAFLGLASFAVLDGAAHREWLPWVILVYAAAYLGFMRLPQSRNSSAIHLSIAVVFLTVAIPLKASGHWITASWLVEGAALLWVATRLGRTTSPTAEILASHEDSDAAYAAHILRMLAMAALILGLGGVFVHAIDGIGGRVSFFHADTITALTGVVAFAAAAWLALRADRSTKEAAEHGWLPIAVASVLAIDLIAALLALREILATIGLASQTGSLAGFHAADLETALASLVIFAGVIFASLRLARTSPETSLWLKSAGATTIAFNVVAVLTGVREIRGLWEGSPAASPNLDAALQQSLAISGFLMLYGAVLLAIGFWRRSAFLRWQALLLLLFTILKAFLYDLRDLSQGYRVASFLALGVLLMAISFAYQRNLLGLRKSNASEPAPDPTSTTS